MQLTNDMYRLFMVMLRQYDVRFLDVGSTSDRDIVFMVRGKDFKNILQKFMNTYQLDSDNIGKEKDVHTEHCCAVHGCKYGNDTCPVESNDKVQSFLCERCQYDW